MSLIKSESCGGRKTNYFDTPGVETKSCSPENKTVVLLVDDDRNDMALFTLAVEQTEAPLWVQTAQGIQQATAYLEGRGGFGDRNLHPQPALVLLDLKMDMGDGFEFLEWRRKSKKFASLPVVVFTGHQYKTDIERALKLGANGYVDKPMSFQELKGAVQQIVELAKKLQSQR